MGEPPAVVVAGPEPAHLIPPIDPDDMRRAAAPIALLWQRAAREDKYILLHMAAVWCHWCHVMERTTYRDAAIQQRIAEKFIAVRVDQDSDPALSYRYENWGWPATIMIDKDGNEIFKRRGYIPPELFGKLLAAVIEDPSVLTTYTAGATVDPFGDPPEFARQI